MAIQINQNPISTNAPAASPFYASGNATVPNTDPSLIDMSQLPKTTSNIGIGGKAVINGQPAVTNTVPISKPTPVVSSNLAASTVKNVIKPVIDTAVQTQTDAQAKQDAAKAFVPASTDKYNIMTGQLNPNYVPPVDNSKAPTAEDKIASAPSDGMQHVYDIKSGTQSEVPAGQAIPEGYSTNNPATRTDVSNTASVGNGVQYKQFSDGTYGRFDSNGNYTGATAQAFQDAQQQQTINDKIKAIQNGTFTLPANQQAQLDGLSSKFNALIEQQRVENANTTGANTIAQNLYGMGNNIIGQGVIAKTVSDGLQKISNLQNELATSLATMQDAFTKDDMSLLKISYDSYNTSQKDIQNEIDKQEQYIQTQADKAQTAIDNKNMAYALQQSSKYGDANILPTDTPQEVDEKRKNSAVYKYETNTKEGGFNQNALDGMLTSYRKTGVVPSFGFGATAKPMREAFWAAVNGTPGSVDESTMNKAALKASTIALDTQQNQYSAAKTSIDQMKQSLDLASTYENKIDKTGSPIVNQYLQWLQGKIAGNSDIAALNAAITTASNEYGRILSGASASIAGTTVSSADTAKALLNSAMSKGQFDSVMSVMKQDANFRITSQKATIDSIKNDILELGKPNTDTSSSTLTKVEKNPNGTLKAVSF